jgi:hypothetical protein
VDEEKVIAEDDGAWQPNVDFSGQPVFFFNFYVHCVANCNQLELVLF